MRQIIYFLGDVHGVFGKLNEFIDREIRRREVFSRIARDCRISGEDFEILIIQLGDFALFWPGCDNRGKIDNRLDFLPGGRIKIHWCGGNHDDWDEIERRLSGRDMDEHDAGIFLHGFGSTLTLANGKTLLFCGGAESVDRDARVMEMMQGGKTCWWKQEGVSREDMERLAAVPAADIVVSHTAPRCFDTESWLVGNGWSGRSREEESRRRLDAVLDRYHPEKWFFGHFHERMSGKTKGCRWLGLADVSQGPEAWQSMDVGEPQTGF